MTHNKSSKVNGIKMILNKNYGVETDLLDVYSLVDTKLRYSENFNLVFDEAKIRGLIRK